MTGEIWEKARCSLPFASGWRLDDSLFIFRVRSLSGKPDELVTADVFLHRGPVQFYDSYDNAAALASDYQLSGYITFKGNIRPDQPLPDKRDLAIAAYGSTIGAQEYDETSGPRLGFVLRRWVMYNIHTARYTAPQSETATAKTTANYFGWTTKK